jgi:hypothetical protein
VFALVVFAAAFASCGDRICEPDEIGNCIDCAMINPNGVCDIFPSSLPQYDPDCNTTAGQDCYNEFFTYSNGKGSSCYPGNCTENTGCVSSCSSDSQCFSGFCIGGECKKICQNCNQSTANYEVYPVSTATYLGEPTFASFRVNKLSGSSPASLSASGPCNLTYDSTIDISQGFGIAIVKITDCEFTGAGSIRLKVNSEAWNVVHILSYPAMINSIGESPSGVVGFAPISGKISGYPVGVKVWVG